MSDKTKPLNPAASSSTNAPVEQSSSLPKPEPKASEPKAPEPKAPEPKAPEPSSERKTVHLCRAVRADGKTADFFYARRARNRWAVGRLVDEQGDEIGEVDSEAQAVGMCRAASDAWAVSK